MMRKRQLTTREAAGGLQRTMRPAAGYWFWLVIALTAWMGVSCEQARSRRAADSRDPGKVSQQEEPLLLLDDEPAGEATAGPWADNSRCHVCHLNYVEEELAVAHARANIGCAGCHGPSDAHIADESWASGGNGTAPDIMFPPEKILPFCLECHPKEKIDPDQHQEFFAGRSREKTCTDCHGDHRLATRKCRWK